MDQHKDIQARAINPRATGFFQDMAMLIEQQGENLNSIEKQGKATNYVHSGNKALYVPTNTRKEAQVHVLLHHHHAGDFVRHTDSNFEHSLPRILERVRPHGQRPPRRRGHTGG